MAESPWNVHERILRENPPSMSYAGGDVAAWQADLRAKLVDLLGLPRMPDRQDPPTAEVLWTREHELGTIQKLRYTCETGCDGLAYLCLPKAIQPPYPLFVCLQGHTPGMHYSIGLEADEQTPRAPEGTDAFGLFAMRQGYAAFCIEQRSFGQRRETAIGDVDQACTCYMSQMNATMIGRTLVGERVFDVQRAIDYLATRDDIDLQRLGCMGNSGGGTATLYATAVDLRIRMALVSCAFSGYEGSIMRIRHCACNYLPGMRRYAEIADVAGLIAPRALVLFNGVADPIFPIESTRAEYARLERIYADAGAPDQCRLVEGPGEHGFDADLAWPAMHAVAGLPGAAAKA